MFVNHFVYETIVDVLTRRGDEAYVGEAVSQKEHALQGAYLAEQENAPDTLVVAALLHDIGHLLGDADGGAEKAQSGIDARHEAVGEAWVRQHFPMSVSEPVRLHVDAKRYLCATQPEYLGKLSPASVRSLTLQGGPMTIEEVAAFEANPFYKEAIRLRGWDDTAKVPGLVVPEIEHYQARIEAVQLP